MGIGFPAGWHRKEHEMSVPLLEINNLKKYFPIRGGWLGRKSYLKAVDDVTLEVQKGEILGLAGESGCGKTTLGRTILRLYEPTAGRIAFEGEDITKLEGKGLRKLKREMQIIFQDPYGSLNPRMRIMGILKEPLEVHLMAKGKEKEDRVEAMIKKVGLSPDHLSRYPHEFSGGQRQRIGIARSLILNPKFVVADEPVSALDMSVQAQILNLLGELKHDFQLTYLLVTHDLAVIKYLCDRIAIMYLGKLVELCPAKDLFSSTLHPYTRALLSACPIPDPDVKIERIILRGGTPSASKPPAGCRFHPRCPQKMSHCSEIEPPLLKRSGEHQVACHLYT
jgi:oligopeptide transport system ATP-binding protein